MAPNISSELTFGIGIGERKMRTSLNKFPFLALAVAVCLLGCSSRNETSSARVSYVTQYTAIEFTFPAGWYKNPKEHPYDLQCFSPLHRMNTGVFAFKKDDVPVDLTPVDIFWQQINDLRSKRQHFEEFVPIQKYEHVDKTVTSITFLGDIGSSRYCYRFSLIEFKEDNTKFAVVLQVVTPEDWDQSEPVLNEITNSAKSLLDDN